ncbi:MAG TPA: MOSC domain-containing protein [Burkholderiales bacterium]|nr:MOSC domain-containing protein [Burkholderiales bacterium]
MQIASLYRYPVKGLSPEKLASVPLAAGEGFPLDRKYALLRTDAAFDAGSPAWLPKANFVMLMLHEQVAGLKTRYLPQEDELRIGTTDGGERSFSMRDESGRLALGRFFHEFLPRRLSGPPRVVEANGHQFTDKAEKYVSLINLASVRELEKRWGESLDPLRFRANVYIDGIEPFAELEWVGRDIRLGRVVATVAQRNGRCAATNVNPLTGVRDRDVPGKLRATFGHKDLGVYLKVIEGGTLQAGDEVEVEPVIGARESRNSPAADNAGLLICSACYYLFDPRKLDAAWTAAKDLPKDYVCPDCGAGRDAAMPASEHRPRS